MMYRLPGIAGTWLDRTRTLQFEFEGRAFTGFAGDTITSALAASGEESAPSIFGTLDGWGAGDGTVVGAKRTVAAPLAILANGALAHSLAFDDTHAASITHASAVVVPVALAIGEVLG